MTSRARDRLVCAALDAARAGALGRTSVTRLADAAGVSRRTFYRHFSSPLDALLQAMECEGAAFARSLTPGQVSPGSAYLESVFAHWADDLELLANLEADGAAQQAIMVWLRGAGAELHGLDAAGTKESQAVRYATSFMTGGVAAALMDWAADEARPTPAQMARVLSFAIARG